MGEKVKLIIEIPKSAYRACRALKTENDQGILTFCVVNAVANGTPLDSVREEIERNAYPIVHGVNNHEKGMTLYGILQVLDNIGKGDSE